MSDWCDQCGEPAGKPPYAIVRRKGSGRPGDDRPIVLRVCDEVCLTGVRERGDKVTVRVSHDEVPGARGGAA